MVAEVDAVDVDLGMFGEVTADPLGHQPAEAASRVVPVMSATCTFRTLLLASAFN